VWAAAGAKARNVDMGITVNALGFNVIARLPTGAVFSRLVTFEDLTFREGNPFLDQIESLLTAWAPHRSEKCEN
jgi:hypothetical protein